MLTALVLTLVGCTTVEKQAPLPSADVRAPVVLGAAERDFVLAEMRSLMRGWRSRRRRRS